MDLPRHQGSYLLAHFREFYHEMARLQRLVAYAETVPATGNSVEADTSATRPLAFSATASYTGEAAAGVAAVPPPSYSLTASTAVWQQLLNLLERQSFEAVEKGGAFAFEIYREAQYLMAALADEVFLNLHWEGRASWPLLESRLFQTHYAGEVVFQRLDRLLQRRDTYYVDLATVYFMALSLGFKGRYRDNDPQGKLQHYRDQLFAMTYRRNPELFTSSSPLFPQALQHTLDEGSGRRLPDRKSWLLLSGGVVIVWLALSGVAWSSLNSSVSCLICKVLSDCVCDAGTGQ